MQSDVKGGKPPEMEGDMAERYEREIDEIIKRTGADLGPRTPLRQAFIDLQRRTKEQLRRQTPTILRVITPTRIGAVGVVLLIGAFVARQSYLAILAVMVLMGAYLPSVIKGNAENEARWRGRPMDTRRRPAWFGKFKQWFSKKPRR